jgi:hypothetical protein
MFLRLSIAITVIAPTNTAATAAAISSVPVMSAFSVVAGKNVDVELREITWPVEVDSVDVCERLVAVVVNVVVVEVVAVVAVGGVYGVTLMLNCSDVEVTT